MPQTLMPKQPELPKRPDPPRKPEPPKRPDPPRQPEPPRQAGNAPEARKAPQNLFLSRLCEYWKGMSIFARIMFVVGLYGVITYGISLGLVLVGAQKMAFDEIPILFPFLSFLLLAFELFQLLSYGGFAFPGVIGTVYLSCPVLVSALFSRIYCIFDWCIIYFIIPVANGPDGDLFAFGTVACVAFQLIWPMARAKACRVYIDRKKKGNK